VAIVPDPLTAAAQYPVKTSEAFERYVLPVAGTISSVISLLVEMECAQARRPM
jgi:hypothetical protein